MTNEVLKTIADRRSHRSYLKTQLSEAQLSALCDAMLQCPSAVNRQPWHFSVVQDQALLQRINEAARVQAMKLPEDKRSPRFQDPAYELLYGAPTVVFISAPEAAYSAIDCGIAVQTIALAAQSMGLGSVIIGMARLAFEGEEKEALEQALQFPEGNRFQIAISLGTPNDHKEPHDQRPEKISLIR